MSDAIAIRIRIAPRVIEANDPRFSEKASIDLLREVGGANLTYIGEDE